MTGRVADLTLGDIASGLSRYRPFLATVAAIVAITFVLPRSRTDSRSIRATIAPAAVRDAVPPAKSGSAPADRSAEASSLTQPRPRRASVVTPALAKARGLKIDFGPNCDLSRGRINVPSIYAPPCVPIFSGDNGGRTSMGVTKDTVTVVVYLPKYNPAAQAIVTAGGVDDDDSTKREQFSGFADYFNAHFETYGRKVRLQFVKATGETTDVTAAKADAIAVTDLKPFASIAAGTVPAAYGEELAARGVICVDCTVLRPEEYFGRHSPYLWDTRGLNLTQQYLLAAEYIGKRLAGRNARWAGQAELQRSTRKLGLIDMYTDQEHIEVMRPAVDAFDRALKTYGTGLGLYQSISLDVSKEQEQARTIIARLKEAGITTVVATGNPVPMVFLTQEATRQLYFPEWLPIEPLMGLNLPGRAYDPAQWAHAFGPTCNGVALPKDEQEADRVYRWHNGNRVPGSLGRIFYLMEQLLFTGIHLAGPKLTPHALRDALFTYPPSGGGPTTPLLAWGRGALWPHEDLSACDDMAEFWWDASAEGEDEAGHPGRGMYRYVDNGRRYRVARWPGGEPRLFDPAGTVARYEKTPPEDAPPGYEHRD